MVVFFRLFKTLFLSAFKKRIGVFDQARIAMRVWPNDLDLNIHANSGRYLSFMDIGRVDLLVRTGVMRKVARRRWRPIAGGYMITYRKSLLPFERFVIKSRVLCWDDKWIYFEHVIVNSKGELSAIANVRGLMRGPDGNVPPADLIALAGDGITSPPMPEFIRHWSEAEGRA